MGWPAGGAISALAITPRAWSAALKVRVARRARSVPDRPVVTGTHRGTTGDRRAFAQVTVLQLSDHGRVPSWQCGSFEVGHTAMASISLIPLWARHVRCTSR